MIALLPGWLPAISAWIAFERKRNRDDPERRCDGQRRQVLDVLGPLRVRALGPEAPDEHHRAGHVSEHRQPGGEHPEAVLGDPGADRDGTRDQPEADRDPGQPQRALEQRRAALRALGPPAGSERLPAQATGTHTSASS